MRSPTAGLNWLWTQPPEAAHIWEALGIWVALLMVGFGPVGRILIPLLLWALWEYTVLRKAPYPLDWSDARDYLVVLLCAEGIKAL